MVGAGHHDYRGLRRHHSDHWSRSAHCGRADDGRDCPGRDHRGFGIRLLRRGRTDENTRTSPGVWTGSREWSRSRGRDELRDELGRPAAGAAAIGCRGAGGAVQAERVSWERLRHPGHDLPMDQTSRSRQSSCTKLSAGRTSMPSDVRRVRGSRQTTARRRRRVVANQAPKPPEMTGVDVGARLRLDREVHIADDEIHLGSARKPPVREPTVEFPVADPGGELVAHPVSKALPYNSDRGARGPRRGEPVHDAHIREVELRRLNNPPLRAHAVGGDPASQQHVHQNLEVVLHVCCETPHSTAMLERLTISPSLNDAASRNREKAGSFRTTPSQRPPARGSR